MSEFVLNKEEEEDEEKKEKAALRCIESKIGIYPDFPKKGILFRDIMPIFGDPNLLDKMLVVLCNRLKKHNFDRVLGIESRGFLIGPLIARKLNLPFSPIRKKGKLPGELHSVDYELEYGKDTLQVQKHSLPENSRCLIVDDLIATGGSLHASESLVEMSGSKVTAFVVIIELGALQGRKKLGDAPVITLFSY